MINVKRIFSLLLLTVLFNLYLNQASATDLEQVVSGSDVEDSLATSKVVEPSPYIIQNADGEIDNQKIKANAKPDFMFNENHPEVSVKEDPKNQFQDLGYTVPGSFEAKENYIEIDKKAMASDFRKLSSGGINITFIKNDFNYESANDVINKTISEGYKHVKGGALYIRSDQYFYHTDYLNTFWSLGGGLGYNSGRGVFVTGERSDTTFKLWEIPVDLGIGIEIPIYHLFKISGAVGPSATVLYQNRNDFLSGEKGRNKIQWSYGQFANAQLKINLAGFSSETAYTLFTESRITNLFMNLEARYQNYRNFQDDIKISGTSFGIGFTFEYL
ncbi:MAG: hypothetical protein H7281_10575 [Bacteriovorax sp.]|nr:hypothetical protein [Bacteriovorax sp.]